MFRALSSLTLGPTSSTCWKAGAPCASGPSCSTLAADRAATTSGGAPKGGSCSPLARGEGEGEAVEGGQDASTSPAHTQAHAQGSDDLGWVGPVEMGQDVVTRGGPLWHVVARQGGRRGLFWSLKVGHGVLGGRRRWLEMGVCHIAWHGTG